MPSAASVSTNEVSRPRSATAHDLARHDHDDRDRSGRRRVRQVDVGLHPGAVLLLVERTTVAAWCSGGAAAEAQPVGTSSASAVTPRWDRHPSTFISPILVAEAVSDVAGTDRRRGPRTVPGMTDDARDGLGRLPREVADRLAEIVRALAQLTPVQRAGATVETVTHPLQPLLRAVAGYAELAVDPMTRLVEGQRELAERMAAWAELQREFAENMAAWAELQREFADVLGALLGPLAESSRRISSVLDQVSGADGAEEPRGRSNPTS